MKTSIRIIILAMIIALGSGCAVKKKLTTEIRHDSVYITHDSTYIEYRDSLRIDTAWIPADEAYIKALLECDSLGKVHLKEIAEIKSGRNVRPELSRRGDTIIFYCEVDSFAVYNILRARIEREHLIQQSTTTTEDSTNIESVTVKRSLPWWIWAIGVVGLLYLLNLFRQKFKLF